MDPDAGPTQVRATALPTARPGLDPDLRRALATEGRRLAALDDPVTVLQESTAFFAVLDQEVAELVGDVRLDAITELRRQGWSHQRIAEACGLTRQRVSQLIREGRPDSA